MDANDSQPINCTFLLPKISIRNEDARGPRTIKTTNRSAKGTYGESFKISYKPRICTSNNTWPISSPNDNHILPLIFERHLLENQKGKELLFSTKRENIILDGVQAHICVQQSVLDILKEGFPVFLAVDTVGARRDVEYETAIHCIERAGAVLTTSEKQ
ncbi:Isochorismatase domain-containing protein 2A, mitochondrial [Galdieria sulphuraria]|nr:Isochorismatase domain-containing protein 2A, mitochondrial [Galdieria sulphuraria]